VKPPILMALARHLAIDVLIGAIGIIAPMAP
jgi:hypothetical protein